MTEATDSSSPSPTIDARRVALEALVRIDNGAFANLALPGMLERSTLSTRDHAFVTELVYGTTRMRRACDWLVERFLVKDPPDAIVRAALRLGAYQLQFLETPAHAAVGETVEAAPKRARGLVNAVLRKVASAGRVAEGDWPSDAVWLSYPDWIVERMTLELGRSEALTSLAAMNEPVELATRTDGYGQDKASQWVAEAVGAQPGERVADLCAAPGGKASILGSEANAVGFELVPSRARKMARNFSNMSASVPVVIADACHPPARPNSFDRVLVDAPCSGLGALRRRADARWNIQPESIDRLATLQKSILEQAIGLVKPGGWLVYSVCTLTAPETTDIATWMAASYPGAMPGDRPSKPWRPAGTGGVLLPHDAWTDGMALFRWRVSGKK